MLNLKILAIMMFATCAQSYGATLKHVTDSDYVQSLPVGTKLYVKDEINIRPNEKNIIFGWLVRPDQKSIVIIGADIPSSKEDRIFSTTIVLTTQGYRTYNTGLGSYGIIDVTTDNGTKLAINLVSLC